jgi:hypothetical protein
MQIIRILLIFSMFISFFELKAQEKFLKLNKIIVIDSTKSLTFNNLPSGRNRLTFFTVKVPEGVFWKIDQILFQYNDNLNSTSGGENIRISINDVFIVKIATEQASTGEVRSFIRSSTLWLAPNTIIKGECITGYSVLLTLGLSLRMSGQEYIVE